MYRNAKMIGPSRLRRLECCNFSVGEEVRELRIPDTYSVNLPEYRSTMVNQHLAAVCFEINE